MLSLRFSYVVDYFACHGVSKSQNHGNAGERTGLCWKKAIIQSYFLSLSLSALHRAIHEYLYAKDCELFMHKQSILSCTLNFSEI